MIRAVRHFLWYLDHHSKRGGHVNRSAEPARVYLRDAPDKKSRNAKEVDGNRDAADDGDPARS